jgi:hypothetical protein
MRPMFHLAVAGGTAHLLPKTAFMALQSILEGLGADTYPLFLRLGGTQESRMQPVTARVLLKEVELFSRHLRWRIIPGIQFGGTASEELGIMYSRPEGDLAQSDKVSFTVTPEGIRLTVNMFPPPVGFRSRPGLKPLHYECFFREIHVEGTEFRGVRTADMGGTEEPVAIPPVPVPPVTRWDYSRVAGKPAVTSMRYIETPATEVYRDLIHAFVSACEESLRLRTPLVFRAD